MWIVSREFPFPPCPVQHLAHGEECSSAEMVIIIGPAEGNKCLIGQRQSGSQLHIIYSAIAYLLMAVSVVLEGIQDGWDAGSVGEACVGGTDGQEDLGRKGRETPFPPSPLPPRVAPVGIFWCNFKK